MISVRPLVWIAFSALVSGCATGSTVLIPRFPAGSETATALDGSLVIEGESDRGAYELRATAIGNSIFLVGVVERSEDGRGAEGSGVPFVGTLRFLVGACRIEVPVDGATAGAEPRNLTALIGPEGCVEVESATVRSRVEGDRRRLEVILQLPHDVMRGNDGALSLDFDEDGDDGVVTLPSDRRIRCIYLQQ